MEKQYNIRTTPINRVDSSVNIINKNCVRGPGNLPSKMREYLVYLKYMITKVEN